MQKYNAGKIDGISDIRDMIEMHENCNRAKKDANTDIVISNLYKNCFTDKF